MLRTPPRSFPSLVALHLQSAVELRNPFSVNNNTVCQSTGGGCRLSSGSFYFCRASKSPLLFRNVKWSVINPGIFLVTGTKIAALPHFFLDCIAIPEQVFC